MPHQLAMGGEVTVAELRKVLSDLDGTMDVVVRAWDDYTNYVGTIDTVQVEYGCKDTPALMLDCGPDDEDE